MPEGRTPYVAGNWKMHKTVAETRAHVDKLLGRLPLGKGVEVGLCVSFTALAVAVECVEGSGVRVLAQPLLDSAQGGDECRPVERGDAQ